MARAAGATGVWAAGPAAAVSTGRSLRSAIPAAADGRLCRSHRLAVPPRTLHGLRLGLAHFTCVGSGHRRRSLSFLRTERQQRAAQQDAPGPAQTAPTAAPVQLATPADSPAAQSNPIAPELQRRRLPCRPRRCNLLRARTGRAGAQHAQSCAAGCSTGRGAPWSCRRRFSRPRHRYRRRLRRLRRPCRLR